MPGGDIDHAGHDYTFWERRIDAMVYLLFKKGVVRDWAEMRHQIESLGPDVYERLSYYERWAAAAAALMIERGVVSREELGRRLAELEESAG
jgi:hypothetical protein